MTRLRSWFAALLTVAWCVSAAAEVATTKSSYLPGEAIVVVFDGLSGTAQDWVSIADRGSPPSQFREWTYTRGAQKGIVTFQGLPAGDYEARAYDGSSTGPLRPRFVRPFVVRSATQIRSGETSTVQRPGDSASSGASVPSVPVASAQASQRDQVIAAIHSSTSGSALAKKAAIDGVKLAVVLAYSEPMQRIIWQQLQLNGAIILNLILQYPAEAAAAAIRAAPTAALSIGVEAATPVAAALLTEAVFRSNAVAGLPESLHNPLKALMQSALVEMVSFGLGAATGHPAALVGPVVRRIDDLRKLYDTVGALGRTLDDGLVATAFGVEASAHLTVDFRDTRSQQVARAVYAELDQRIVDIVGKRFEADVREIYRTGHAALVAQRRGDEAEARRLVLLIQRKGDLAQGVHPLSAIVSPGFWVNVVSRGGVPPVKRAAMIIIVATRLKDL